MSRGRQRALQRQLNALEQEKGELKREGRMLGANISHVLNDHISAFVDELSALRLEQEKLAVKIRFAKSVSDAHEWTVQCREMDAQLPALEEDEI